MVRILILYETQYGFTEKAAKSLSLILGPAKCAGASQFKANADNWYCRYNRCG